MSKTYKERGLPGVQNREIRLYTNVFIDGKHTMAGYLCLYRQGKARPLRYEFNGVPIVCCRRCGDLRPDDGTPCTSCGAYQHCTPITLDADSRIAEAQRSAAARLAGQKPINPRRRTCHGRS